MTFVPTILWRWLDRFGHDDARLGRDENCRRLAAVAGPDPEGAPCRLDVLASVRQTSLGVIAGAILGVALVGSAQPVAMGTRLAQAAEAQVGVTTSYDPAYRKLSYPGGDVPRDRGVCTDVVVRSFRAIGVDLQVMVHEDMRRNFRRYPQSWGLRGTDRNIDHRRVPNLMTFFARKGKLLPVNGTYEPGDVVAWRLSNGLLHIGVVARGGNASGRPLVVHNIGSGAQREDVLESYRKIGHYRW